MIEYTPPIIGNSKAALLAVLKDARALIRTLHDRTLRVADDGVKFYLRHLSQGQLEEAWIRYQDRSPAMQRLNAAIAEAEAAD